MTGEILKAPTPAEIARLDTIANSALEALSGLQVGTFEQTFAMAQAMGDLREAITPAMMARFMRLQNIKLGFMTDRNPNVWNKKEAKYNEPYSEAVVKDCVIEATLRGVRPIGNQFNIISGGCYITQEGFAYKLKNLTGLSEFKPLFGVPKVSQGGALVECEATWLFKGKPDSMKATIACKGDDYAGADSYVGKATRKFYKRVFDRLTGIVEPDGEADEEPTAQLEVPLKKTGEPVPSPAPENRQPPQPPPKESPADPPEPKGPTTLLAELVLGAGFTFTQFQIWASQSGNVADADSLASFHEIPVHDAARILRSSRPLLTALRSIKEGK